MDQIVSVGPFKNLMTPECIRVQTTGPFDFYEEGTTVEEFMERMRVAVEEQP